MGFRNRNWGTANQGWVDVDPSGNKMNKKSAEKQQKEDDKYTEMTKKEFEKYVASGKKHYGVSSSKGVYTVKIKR